MAKSQSVNDLKLPDNPHRCSLVKNFPNSRNWGNWRLYYYPKPLPEKSQRQYIDIPGAWDSTTGWRWANYVLMAVVRNQSIEEIILAARGDYQLSKSDSKKGNRKSRKV